jgi:LPS-assembly protein
MVLVACTPLAGAAEEPRADKPLQGCPVDAPPVFADLPPADPNDTRVEVFTGRAEVDIDAGAVFSDGITIRRGAGVLRAPGARYDQASGEFTLEGGLAFGDPQTAISGTSAEFDSQQNTLRIVDAEFQLFAVPSRGSAGRIAVEQDDKLLLEDVTYTTCARGNEDWVLRADEIDIDRDEGIGTARGARLEFKGVPIFYTPWISYPVTDKRKSGFLLPGLGRSETRGVEFQIPYYFNIAPNLDATLTPRYMTQRGLELISEFRYLWPTHTGTLEAEYLPNDKGTNDNRYLFGWDHTSTFGNWRATSTGRTVSDTRYFEDLSGSSSATSQTHLRRVVDVEYWDDIWSVLLRMQDFKTLDESLVDTDKPYRVLPQLRVGAILEDQWGFDLALTSEIARFDRDIDATGLTAAEEAAANPTGARLHLSPSVSLPVDWRGLHFEPAIALEHTMYSIDEPAPGEDDGPDRTTPIYSVDLGTVFERSSSGGGAWLQTLEPRMQYVYIPYRNQDELPVFDTIEPDFNLVQLYRRNRFLGHDRLGDTDQLSIGLTSRLIDAANGTQFMAATIGQTRFFSDQRVTLAGDSTVTSKSSDWLAELDVNFAQYWKADLGVQWDSDQSRLARGQARLQYRRDGRRVANLAYRYRRSSVDSFVSPVPGEFVRPNGVDEIDLSAAWPISDRWSFVGRYNYSLFDPREPDNLPPEQKPIEPSLIEGFVGFEYENCCWGLRLVYRRYLASRTGEFDNVIAVQLVLKGLTNVGDPADRLLERGILGYETD